MKKPLLLFLLFSALLLLAGIAYTKYCKSKPNGCRKIERDAESEYPREGIDW
jgi:hypothetical protein